MAFELPTLPYSTDALMPHMSPETFQYHYGKHHKAYVDNLNKLVPGTEFEKMSLEDIVKKSRGSSGTVFLQTVGASREVRSPTRSKRTSVRSKRSKKSSRRRRSKLSARAGHGL